MRVLILMLSYTNIESFCSNSKYSLTVFFVTFQSFAHVSNDLIDCPLLHSINLPLINTLVSA